MQPAVLRGRGRDCGSCYPGLSVCACPQQSCGTEDVKQLVCRTSHGLGRWYVSSAIMQDKGQGRDSCRALPPHSCKTDGVKPLACRTCHGLGRWYVSSAVLQDKGHGRVTCSACQLSWTGYEVLVLSNPAGQIQGMEQIIVTLVMGCVCVCVGGGGGGGQQFWRTGCWKCPDCSWAGKVAALASVGLSRDRKLLIAVLTARPREGSADPSGQSWGRTGGGHCADSRSA